MFMYMSNLIMPPLLPPLSGWHREKFKLKGKEREKMCLRECDLEREWLQMRLRDRENATKRESRDDARNKYGLYTVEQWEKLLKLGWNKS